MIWIIKGYEILMALTVVGMVVRDRSLRDYEGMTSYERIKRSLPVFYRNLVVQETVLIALDLISIGVALSGHVIVALAVVILIPVRVRQARAIDNLRNVTFLQRM